MGEDSRLPVVASFCTDGVRQVDKVHPNPKGECEYTVFFFGDNTQYCNMLIKS